MAAKKKAKTKMKRSKKIVKRAKTGRAVTKKAHTAAYSIEQYTRFVRGAPPITVEREIIIKNGDTRKATRLIQGNRILTLPNAK